MGPECHKKASFDKRIPRKKVLIMGQCLGVPSRRPMATWNPGFPGKPSS